MQKFWMTFLFNSNVHKPDQGELPLSITLHWTRVSVSFLRTSHNANILGTENRQDHVWLYTINEIPKIQIKFHDLDMMKIIIINYMLFIN